ncbi:MAG: hypothetical protein MHM6MM_000262 [Cercozoa sp. M6MM]
MSDPIDPGEEKHALVGLNVFLFVVFVVVCLVIGYVLRVRRLMWLPESGAHMLFGLVIGGFLTLLGPDEVEYITFDPELFFFVLLPPIIFEAGFTLKQREFFGNIGAILSFAVLGTLVSTLVIGLCIYVLALAHVVPLDRESPLESLLFGALISAVDPVATLAILGNEHVNADRTLRALVFGESVLNDAVSIVLFNSLKKFGEQRERAKGDDDYEAVSMGNAVSIIFWDFWGVSLGSLLVGVGLALCCSFLLRRANLHHDPAYEFAVFILCVFGTYSLAETLEFSGVISLFCCGIVMSHYALHSMSRIARNATKHIFKTFAMLAETFVFVYLGITAGISFAPSQHMVWSVMFILFTILLCFASRACHIFPFSMLLNLRRRKRITRPMQVALLLPLPRVALDPSVRRSPCGSAVCAAPLLLRWRSTCRPSWSVVAPL